MEFFNGNNRGEMISIQEMIEHDMRSSVAEGMVQNSSNFVQSSQQSRLRDSLGPMNSIISIAGNQTPIQQCNTSLNGSHMTSMHNISNVELDSSGSLPNLSWLHNMNVSEIQQQAMVENTDPNLMVDPQTGLPINGSQQQQPSHQIINGQQIQGQIVGYELARTPVTFASTTASPAIQYVTIQDSQNRQPVYIAQNTPVSLAQALRTVPQTVTQQFTFSTPTTTHVQGYTTSTPTTVQIVKDEKQFPKPVYSYSCLIAMSLKNSKTGSLPVSEIYNFMTSHFPYFKTAPDGWKNSVRHNLSLNKCFEKIENPKSNGNTRKGCLWAMNPAKIKKMDDEISKWNKKDPVAIRKAMSNPEVLEILEQGKGQGLLGNLSTQNGIPVSVTQIADTPSDIKVETFTSLKDADIFMNTDILDSSLHLDPALSELALQNGLWDDDELFSEFPIGTSPISFSRLSSPPGYKSTSPIRLTPTGRAFQAAVM